MKAKQKSRMNLRSSLSFCLLLIFLFQLSFTGVSYASDSTYEKIRVGYCDMPGFTEIDKNGDRWGYGYQYLLEYNFSRQR
ncbi:hypothetical protein SAMN02745248_02497 [Hathewaya proteolytica DSM 3090]|uniref:Uncharacterized protein n=1 Tax=Hathewaya proteolytica DSM 3090 TaxID=1121331 RepID=A0A1M6SA61_9CLOT|nr:hypothetical protein [Hathewaya proteolytica]SHK41550.1 hypothetical protein SAMN02745248_02497 [Hathewaya proteolytica DSM 3090]